MNHQTIRTQTSLTKIAAHSSRPGMLVSLVSVGAIALFSCGGTDEGYGELEAGSGTSGNGSSANGASSSGSGTTGGASAVNGASSASGTTGLQQNTTGASGTSTTGAFEECVGTVSEGEALALDMFIVLDHTTSMTEGQDSGEPAEVDAACPLVVGGTPAMANKWCYATHALASFFVNNTAPGARAALNFMAMPGYVCEGGPNNPQSQAVVGLTQLPVDAANPLITALSDDGPYGVGDGNASTAIEAALRGIADYTVANRTPGRKMIGILITDGDPTVCNTDVPFLGTLVSDHLTNNGIETYIIGMTGSTEANLEVYAVGGGAPEHTTYCGSMASCHYWTVGDGDPAAFVDALNQIQAAALLPCSYQIPDPPAGEVVDINLVNAEFTTATGEQIKMTRVDAAVGCQPGVYQWYYDNPAAPTSLELCPDACQVATEQGQGSSVKVAYGCATNTDVK